MNSETPRTDEAKRCGYLDVLSGQLERELTAANEKISSVEAECQNHVEHLILLKAEHASANKQIQQLISASEEFVLSNAQLESQLLDMTKERDELLERFQSLIAVWKKIVPLVEQLQEQNSLLLAENAELNKTCAELTTDSNAITLAENLHKMEAQRNDLFAGAAALACALHNTLVDDDSETQHQGREALSNHAALMAKIEGNKDLLQ